MTGRVTELQKRLREIIKRCKEIDALVNDVGLEGRAPPVLRALTKQADRLAARRFERVAGVPIETVQKQDFSGNNELQTKVKAFADRAAHTGQPTHLVPSRLQFDHEGKPIVDENGAQLKTLSFIDFHSVSHVATLLLQIKRFKRYARLGLIRARGCP